ncbi:unspecified product [Plasmodium malariae]|uniref:Unspecified product n=1 Tax=Plasmodium malariae TaxID=5858 RepID=A0A1A8WQQ8_PLAMA|nr:unspecified product [Plasmodium malariae]
MTSENSENNDNSVELFLKNKEEFIVLSQVKRRGIQILESIINEDNQYSDDYIWFNGYKEISSHIDNTCMQEIKKVDQHILKKLENLYKLYPGFKDYRSNKNKAESCENPENGYKFYIEHYKECNGNIKN